MTRTPRTSRTPRSPRTPHTSRLKMDETSFQDHWEYDLKGKIEPRLEARISASLGLPLNEMNRKSGAFGYVYYMSVPTGENRAVVKLGTDWMEAGMSAWIMRRQRGKGALAPLMRAIFPKIIDTAQLLTGNPGEHEPLYATVREDVEFSTRELYDAINERSGFTQSQHVSGLLHVVKLAGQQARDFVEQVTTLQDPRDVATARSDNKKAWSYLIDQFNGTSSYMTDDMELEAAIRSLLSVLYTLATKHGIGISDLHDGNIRFRSQAPARGWEQAYYPAPVISDYGMSAVKKGSGVVRRATLPNPMAWERPRIVRV